jgi:PleD family two-component response regulator
VEPDAFRRNTLYWQFFIASGGIIQDDRLTKVIARSHHPVGSFAIAIISHPELSPVSPRLLLAEDDPDLRQDLQQHFQRRGFAVHACENGSEAQAVLEPARPVAP